MLRLIHPAPEGGQATRPPRGRRAPALSLSAEEVRHLRAATRNAVRAYGGAGALAEVMGVRVKVIHNATGEKGTRTSGTFAIRLARAAGMSVEAVLGHSGALSEAGRCKACGARMADGRVAS